MPPGRCYKAGVLVISVILGACSATQITYTPRSSIEQRLLVLSLDRSLAQFDTTPLQGKSVAVEFHGLTPDKDFAREFCVAWLEARRIRVTDANRADLRVKILAPALAVDRGQAFFGVPSITVPILGVHHAGSRALQIYDVRSLRRAANTYHRSG